VKSLFSCDKILYSVQVPYIIIPLLTMKPTYATVVHCAQKHANTTR